MSSAWASMDSVGRQRWTICREVRLKRVEEVVGEMSLRRSSRDSISVVLSETWVRSTMVFIFILAASAENEEGGVC